MKPWILALAIILSHGFYAWPENIGVSDDENMSYIDPDGESGLDRAASASASAESMSRQEASPQTTRRAGGCRVPDNGVRSSPVKVYVDQASQTIRVEILGENDVVLEVHEGKVTTGGGLKIPNGKIPRKPYCAVTPAVDHRIIRAVRERDFGADSGCSPGQITANSTVFDIYRSNTFTDVAGNPAPMAQAIRVDGGVFFHTAGREYMSHLGTQSLSGGCIRLGPKMAAWLKDKMEEYGALDVTISKNPEITDPRDRRYCDREMEQAALMGRQANRLQGQYYTGTEGIYHGGRQGMENLVKSFGQFGGKVIQGVSDVITSPFRILNRRQ